MTSLGWQSLCGCTTEHKSLCHPYRSEICPIVPEGSSNGEIRCPCQHGELPPPPLLSLSLRSWACVAKAVSTHSTKTSVGTALLRESMTKASGEGGTARGVGLRVSLAMVLNHHCCSGHCVSPLCSLPWEF